VSFNIILGNDVPEDVLKLLRKDFFRLRARLIKNIEKPKNFIEVTVTVVQKSQNVQNSRTMAQSASSHIQQR